MKVYKNGVFISCDNDDKAFSVLVEDKGKIVFTGDTVPGQYAKAPAEDMNGTTVMPAFADTHLHFESYALFLSTVDVRHAANFEEMGQTLKDYMTAHRKEKFLPAYGCSAHTVAEKRLPNKDDLDKMLSVPLFIVKYDGHAAVANSALIRDFPADVTSDPGFDAATGWLYQNAFYKGINYVTAKVPPLRILNALQKASIQMAGAGIGYMHTVEGVGYKNDLDIDTLMMARYGLPQYFKIFFQTTEVDKVLKRGLRQIGGCFKLALDGCLGSEDAAIIGGYHNNPDNKGFLLYTQQEVNDFCIKANRADLQIAMHAIGDAAVEQALTAYEAALKDHERQDHRHIIIHADLIPLAMIKRAAKLGISIALQPNFLRWPQEPGTYLEHILGEKAMELLPLRSLLDNGILLSAGSDAPCTLPNPLESICNCVTHPNPAQRISIKEALKMHTLWAAKMGFDENERGSLSNGKAADFITLSGNPLKTAPEEIKNLSVTGIRLEGKPIDSQKERSLPGFLLSMVGGCLSDSKGYGKKHPYQ